ncbi:immunoglobulin domain-containing protein [Synoicihabitans lomoniglobus]|uniref:Immunoglobulin domain-containing protein n=1 Tax=Synoicihabitans lomoniglobus TaxID=2909285 RepID=A0AAF0CMS7_9BACT|nr:immunoglobulin domain-containing protein [Opitutaceae bacterium LMO-M01]
MGSYAVKISNAEGSVVSAAAELTGSDPAPVITVQPQSQSPVAGTATNLSVQATGTDLGYQWRRNGSEIPNATESSFYVASTSIADGGVYDVVVSSGLASTISSAVTLVVAPSSYAGLVSGDLAGGLQLERPDQQAYRVWPLADGRAYVAGHFHVVNDVRRPFVVRLKADGALDPTFAVRGITGTGINALLVQPDGKVVIGGSFTTVAGAGNLARLNVNGSVDTTFQSYGFNRAVLSLSVTSDGRILAGGDFESYRPDANSYIPRSYLAVLRADGTLDSDVLLPVLNNSVNLVLGLSDGKILVGGGFSDEELVPIPGIVWLNGDGSWIVRSSSPAGSVFWSAVEQADGRILVGGVFDTVDGESVSNLVRFSAPGELDLTFSEAVGVVDGGVRSMAVTEDGGIWLGGEFTAIEGTERPLVAKLQSSGSLDLDFTADVSSAFSTTKSIGTAADGSLWMVGEVAVPDASGVARIDQATGAETEFTAPVLRLQAFASTTLALPGNELLVAGTFSHLNGIETESMVRIASDQTVAAVYDLGFSESLGSIKALMRQPDGGVVIAGSFVGDSDLTGTASSLMRVKPDGTRDESFATTSDVSAGGVNVQGSVEAMAAAADGRFVIAGWFSAFGGDERRDDVARFFANGQMDPSFDAGDVGLSGSVLKSLVVDAQNRTYLGGAFTTFAGHSREGVVRLLPDGSVDETYPNLGVNGTVHDIALDAAGKLVVVGNFSSVDGSPVPGIARFNSDGTRDLALGTTSSLGAHPQQLLVQPDGKMLLSGSFTTVAGTINSPYLVRLNEDGSRDETFAASHIGGEPTTLGMRDDGRLFVSGVFPTIGGFLTAVEDPAIQVDPTDQSVSVGGGMTVSVEGTGGGLSYQWRRNGRDIVGATAATLSLDAATVNDAGLYDVVITNLAGRVVSESAVVSVAAPMEEQRVLKNISAVVTAAADERVLVPFKIEGAGIKSMLMRAVGPTLGVLGVDGFMPDPVLRVLRPSGELIASNDDWSSDEGNQNAIQLAAFQVGAFGLSEGTLDAALVVELVPGRYILEVVGAEAGRVLVECYDADGSDPTARLVHMGLLATQGTGSAALNVGFVVQGSSRDLLVRAVGPGVPMDHRLADPSLDVVASGSSGNVPLLANDNWDDQDALEGIFRYAGASALMGGSLDAAVVGTFDAGAYTGRVKTPISTTGTVLWEVFDLANTSATLAPELVLPVQSTETVAGGSVTMGVLVAGAEPLTYVWHKNDVLLPSETGSRLSRGDLTHADNGTYEVTVSNDHGDLTVVAAVIDLPVPPSIANQPIGVTASGGDDVTFSVTVAGTPPFTYQWLHDGQPIAGATSDELQLDGVNWSNAGGYSVEVTSDHGSVRSATVELAGAGVPPTVALSAASLVATVGDEVAVSLVTGATDATYQWRRNGFDLPGETGTTLQLPGVSLLDTDRYEVVVRDGPSLSEQVSEAFSLHVFPAKLPTAITPDARWHVALEGGPSSLTGFFALPDGGALVVGSFSQINGHATPNLARLNAAGEVMASFTAPDLLPSQAADLSASIAIQGGNHLIVVTRPRAIEGQSRQWLKRFDLTSGELDETFAVDVGLSDEIGNFSIGSVAVAADQKLVVVALLQVTTSGGPLAAVVRLSPDGDWDTTFAISYYDTIPQLPLALVDGGALVGGTFSMVNGVASQPVVRLGADGALDVEFAANLDLDGFSSPEIQPLLEMGEDKLYLGISTNGNGTVDVLAGDGSRLSRLQGDGAPRRMFAQADGTVLVWGFMQNLEGVAVNGLALLDQNGTVMATPLELNSSQIDVVSASSSGRVYMKGVNYTNGQPFMQRWVRGTNDVFNLSLATLGLGRAYDIAPLDNGEWLVAGDFDKVNGADSYNLVRLAADGTLAGVYGDEFGPQGSIEKISRRSDGQFDLKGSSNPAPFGIMRLDATGALNPSFTLDPTLSIASLIDIVSLPRGGLIASSWYFAYENGLLREVYLNEDGSRSAGLYQSTTDTPFYAGVVLQNGNHVTVSTDGFRSRDNRGIVDEAFHDDADWNSTVIGLSLAMDESIWAFGFRETKRLADDGSVLAETPVGNSFGFEWVGNGPDPRFAALPDGDILVANYSFAFWMEAFLESPITRLNPDLSIDDSLQLSGVHDQVTAMRLTEAGDLLLSVPGAVFMTRATDEVVPRVTAADVVEVRPVGGSVELTVTDVPSGELTYQWRHNRTPIEGATAPTLRLADLTLAEAGRYDVVITGTSGDVLSDPFTLEVAVFERVIAALSAHLELDADEVAFLPFRIEGLGEKQVLLRAIGPTLSGLGIDSAMQQPRIRLVDETGEIVMLNDGWANSVLVADTAATVGAVTFAADSEDAALVALLPAGNYVAMVVDEAGGTGLVELFDAGATSGSSRIVHGGVLSRDGGSGLSLGFVVDRFEAGLLVRAVAPGLGLGDTSLIDPVITLHNSSMSTIAENDDWDDTADLRTAFAIAGASPLVADSSDAAVTVVLPAGAFTATTTTQSSEGGRTLVEVYDLSGRAPPEAPVLLMPALSQTVAADEAVRFEVVAAGAGSLAYQWYHDGELLDGATTGTFALSAAKAADSGNYTVRIANSHGFIESAPATLTVITPPTLHDADTNGDRRIGLVELLRVIQLYNTRFGTSRTGRYAVAEGSVDGFTPDNTSSSAAVLSRYHTGDTNRDGRVSLIELLRVIQLYNTRSGTSRTGAYRPADGTVDGFEPESSI